MQNKMKWKTLRMVGYGRVSTDEEKMFLQDFLRIFVGQASWQTFWAMDIP